MPVSSNKCMASSYTFASMVTNVNVLVSLPPGLLLPRTLCLSIPPTVTTEDLSRLLRSLLPDHLYDCLSVTTPSNKRLLPRKDVSVADFSRSSSLGGTESAILPLRLTPLLVGGKGGFGSQLRAAGGRMSSKKRRQNAELASGSARNLDGRRLRTITEAKNLAAYLATKPDMDRKEKEERRKRWQQVIDLAEQREADMRAGKGVDGRRKGLSEEWIEEKEEVGENVRNAVQLAMAAAADNANDFVPSGSDQSTQDSTDEDSEGDDHDEGFMELDVSDMDKLRREAEAGDVDAMWVLRHKLKIPSDLLPKVRVRAPRFVGFDEEEISSDDAEEPITMTTNDSSQDSGESAKGKATIQDTLP